MAWLSAGAGSLTSLQHELSNADRDFRSAFEDCLIGPSQFNHQAHVRLAYVFLVEHDTETAVEKMRQALLNFLEHNEIPRSKYHETLTRAWILAVRHFMDGSRASNSAAEFIEANRQLLDSQIMLTHYSATVLFSAEARALFVEPDINPIPPVS